jgi:signal peptidase I
MKKPSLKRILAILCVGMLAYTVGSLFQPTVVIGDSMSPTLVSGRWIYVDRLYYQTHTPVPGEVVVFRHDGNTYVKRVYRGPGQSLHYLGDSDCLVTLVSDLRLKNAEERYGGDERLRVRELRVPNDSVYVLGDNYLASEDSRQLGPIPISEIVGRARLPVDQTIAERWELRPGAKRIEAQQRARRLTTVSSSRLTNARL